MRFTKKEKKTLAEYIRQSVENLSEWDDSSVYAFPLNDGTYVAVGWRRGYGKEKRDDAIQSKSDPDYAICVGIKVNDSFLSCNYEMDFSDAEGHEEITVRPNEDYEALVEAL